MAYLFRDIRRKSWWNPDRRRGWLQENELAADVFKGLATINGELSTYVIDAEKARVHRVVAALACTRDNFQPIDYVLIPFDAVASLFSLSETLGETPDDEVNGWHVDVIHLTPSKLVDLVYLIREHKDAMRRFPKKQVESAVLQGIDADFINRNRVNRSLQTKLP